jgi:hypothetical protein
MPIFRRKTNHKVTITATQWSKHSGVTCVVGPLPPDHSAWDAAGESIAAGYGYFQPTGTVVVPGDYIVDKLPGVGGVFHEIVPRELFEAVWEPATPVPVYDMSHARSILANFKHRKLDTHDGTNDEAIRFSMCVYALQAAVGEVDRLMKLLDASSA